MAILQVRDIDDRLYEQLRTLSRCHRRSMSQEVTNILEEYLSNPDAWRINPTDEFLALSGSWEDERSAEEISAELHRERAARSRVSI